MSAAAMDWAWSMPGSVIEKIVLLVFAYHADEAGFVGHVGAAAGMGTKGVTGPIYGQTATLDWVWGLPIKPRKKVTLLALAWRADKLGLCQAPPMELASMCGLKLATTLAVLGHLVAIGLISATATGSGYIVLSPAGSG